jgi:GNAT superfamily N-acetyltransferase
MIKIKKVDGLDGLYEDLLKEMHYLTMGDSPMPDFTVGTWWLAYDGKDPVAFCGLTPSDVYVDAAYLKRAGVLPAWQGRGLQRRMIRIREREARKAGFLYLRTDVSNDNPASANNLIKCGFRMFWPKQPWAFDYSTYWVKDLAK